MGKTIPLLRRLAISKLPAVIDESDQREAVKLLKALGWVVADRAASPSSSIVVQEVTFAGKATLAVADTESRRGMSS